MSDIFQEVDEELREEKYKSIWRKYKYYLIGVLVLFVLAVSVNAFWKNYSLNEVNDRSERFFAALEMSQNDKIGAISLLEEFSKEESGGSEYNTLLAKFNEASIRKSENDFSGALVIYEELINNNVSSFYVDYAKLSMAEMLISLNNKTEAKLILEELVSSSSDLIYIAMEYIGYIEINDGNIAEARIIFNNLVNDASTTSNMKNRSREILSIFP